MFPVELIAVTLSPPTVDFKTKALIREKALFSKVDSKIGTAKNNITFQGEPIVKSTGLNNFLIPLIIDNFLTYKLYSTKK